MTNRLVTLSSGATAAARNAYDRRDAVAVASQEKVSGLASVHTTEKMFQTASRLMMSLRPGEQIIACTGIAPDDPSAKFAVQVALALVRLGQGPVLVVDADFPTPTIHTFAWVSKTPGFADLLAGDAAEDFCIRKTGVDGLYLLAAGESAESTPALLTSSTADKALESFRQFPLTVLNVGAVLESCGGLLVASRSDVVVAALASGQRTMHELKTLKTEIGRLKARFLGVVVVENQ